MRTAIIFAALAVGLAGCKKDSSRPEAEGMAGGNAEQGKAHLKAYGCGTCHIIPGVPNATGTIGPSLQGVATRSYLAGERENNLDNMLQWIQHPRKQVPATAMPETGVDEAKARDIAAYLYTLK